MIPKKPAPDLIRGGNRLSEKDHAPAKYPDHDPIQLDRIMVWGERAMRPTHDAASRRSERQLSC
jgi:hypothetical protein